MDGSQFDGLTRSLTTSRRSLLGGALALAGGSAGFTTTARKKRKKKKKPQPLAVNQYGCVEVGQPCRGDSANCCSGICEGAAPRKGKPDHSRCVAHHAGVCTLETNSCEIGIEIPCGRAGTRGGCTVTTGQAAFCADVTAGTTAHCRVCSKDTDCQGEFGPSAACVLLDGGCTPLCLATGRTACLPAAV